MRNNGAFFITGQAVCNSIKSEFLGTGCLGTASTVQIQAWCSQQGEAEGHVQTGRNPWMVRSSRMPRIAKPMETISGATCNDQIIVLGLVYGSSQW